MKSNIGKMKVSSKAVEEIGHFTKCCRLLKLDILTIHYDYKNDLFRITAKSPYFKTSIQGMSYFYNPIFTKVRYKFLWFKWDRIVVKVEEIK